MNKKRSGRLALAGIFTALAVACLLMTISPIATVGLAALAAVCGIPVVIESGRLAGLVHFASVAVLTLLLVPTIEGKGMYIAFFGWYTVFKSFIEGKNLPIATEWVVKIGAFLVAVAAYGAVWIWLLDMPIHEPFTLRMFPVAAVVLTVVFVVYDVGLSRLVGIYFTNVGPKLRQIFRF